MDWLREHLWALWIGGGMLLGAAEILTLDFTLLMLAGGALAGGITAIFLPGLVVVQALVAIAVAVLLLVVLRPTLLARVRNAPGYRGSIEKLVGSNGVATAEITEDSGEVKVDGLTWTARLVLPGRVPVGGKVEVYEVDGTTAAGAGQQQDAQQWGRPSQGQPDLGYAPQGYAPQPEPGSQQPGSGLGG